MVSTCSKGIAATNSASRLTRASLPSSSALLPRNDETLGQSYRSYSGSCEKNQGPEGHNNMTVEILFTTSEGRDESRNEIMEESSALVLPIANHGGNI